MTRQVAVIGCGYWGKNLIRNFSELGALFAICDSDKELAKKVSDEFQIPSLGFEDILASECQGIVIAVPASLHSFFAIKALNASKHVFVEKPLAMTIEDAESILLAASRSNRRLMVGHLLQYHPAFLALQEKIRNGYLGELKYMYSNRLSFGKIRSEEDVIWSFAPHDISMILSLVESEISSVFCKASSLLQNNISDMAPIYL